VKHARSGILGLAMLLAGMGYGVSAEADPLVDNITVSIRLTKQVYSLTDPADPLKIVMTVANQGPRVQVPRGFAAQPFERYLVFRSPDGRRVIATQDYAEGPTPGSPQMVVLPSKKLLAVEATEGLLPNASKQTRVGDARTLYNLDQPGWWSVEALIPIRVHPTASLIGSVLLNGAKINYFVPLDDPNAAAGAIRSGRTYFRMMQ
jgi:hypothetical protein